MAHTALTRRLEIASLALCASLALGACSQSQNGPGSANLSSADGRNGQQTPATPGSRRDFAQNIGDLVYFTTDSSDLTPEAQQTLRGQARWLSQYPKYTITIEGHADERGTREYNIALGARRATSVKRFLSQNGIDARRLRTISFGKERPVAVCDDISCWSQNRRAQTTLNNRVGS
ncbi:MAG: peptidoglycan-associated lipoprotein Pal [Pseudomonadota bacterium]